MTIRLFYRLKVYYTQRTRHQKMVTRLFLLFVFCYSLSCFADTQNRAKKHSRLHCKAATSAALCGTARKERDNKLSLRRCILLGGNKNLPRCGVPCTPLPPCGKRELTAQALRSGFVYGAEELHFFFNGSLDSLEAGSEELSRVKALALKILAVLDVLSCSFLEGELALGVNIDL